mgnify:CR=1 FL=1
MRTTSAKILLISVFVARGTSFLFSKTLMDSIPPMSILAVRFLLSFAILALVFHRRLRACSRSSLRGGLILGFLYTVCMVFEMYGLRLIDSGVSSLIENMAIVLVPIYLAVYTRTLPEKRTLLCAVLAVAGVGFLTLTQRELSGGALGVALAICAAMTYAACIIMTERVTRGADAITVGILQLGTMGLLSLIIALPTEHITLPHSAQQWTMMLLLVLVCSCFGFTFQPLAQKYIPAETAAVFTVVNPLTASVMGIAVAGEKMTLPKLAGYLLILLSLTLYSSAKKSGATEQAPS